MHMADLDAISVFFTIGLNTFSFFILFVMDFLGGYVFILSYLNINK